MSVAERRVAHVRELDVALRARVHEHIALRGVELGRGDDLRELFHVHRLDINNVWQSRNKSAELVNKSLLGNDHTSTH